MTQIQESKVLKIGFTLNEMLGLTDNDFKIAPIDMFKDLNATKITTSECMEHIIKMIENENS